MEKKFVRVEVGDDQVTVAPEFERLARAAMTRGIRLVDVYRPESSPADPEGDDFFTVVTYDSGSCEDLATLVCTGASDFLRKAMFDQDWCLEGSFSVHPFDDGSDGPPLVCFMHMDFPLSELGQIVDAVEAHPTGPDESDDSSGFVTDASGGLLDPSRLPPCVWDGAVVPMVMDIDKVQPGVHVLLAFRSSIPVEVYERIWVRVSSMSGSDAEGTLSGHPKAMSNLSLGDSVRFRLHDVLEVSLQVPMASQVLLN
jgi:hypothetical protein